MRATKLGVSVQNMNYQDRLKQLKLPTLKFRSIRGDIIEVYKIMTNSNKINMTAKLICTLKNWKVICLREGIP